MSFLIVIVPFDDLIFFIPEILGLGPNFLCAKIIMSLPTKGHKNAAIFLVDLVVECASYMIDLYYFVGWLKVCQVFGFMASFTSFVSWVMLVIWLCQNNKTQCLKSTIVGLKSFTSKFSQVTETKLWLSQTQKKYHAVLQKENTVFLQFFRFEMKSNLLN